MQQAKHPFDTIRFRNNIFTTKRTLTSESVECQACLRRCSLCLSCPNGIQFILEGKVDSPGKWEKFNGVLSNLLKTLTLILLILSTSLHVISIVELVLARLHG
jgi:hypothetical protein